LIRELQSLGLNIELIGSKAPVASDETDKKPRPLPQEKISEAPSEKASEEKEDTELTEIYTGHKDSEADIYQEENNDTEGK
jgi:hypothetical protein